MSDLRTKLLETGSFLRSDLKWCLCFGLFVHRLYAFEHDLVTLLRQHAFNEECPEDMFELENMHIFQYFQTKKY